MHLIPRVALVLVPLASPALAQTLEPEGATLVTPDGASKAEVIAPWAQPTAPTLPPAREGEKPLALLEVGNLRYELSGVLDGPPPQGFYKDWRESASGYRLRCFSPDGLEWEKELPLEGIRLGEAAGILSGPHLHNATEGLEHLSEFGAFVLVAPGPRDSVWLLDPSDGAQVRRIERLWEFQRGFMGPSVYSHYISRFGDEQLHWSGSNPTEQAVAHLARRREAFDSHTNGYLLAGPVVNGDRAFVVVAHAPTQHWGGRLVVPVVHEINLGLQHVTVGHLPDLVLPKRHALVDDGVVWATLNRGLVAVGRTEQPIGGGMRMGGGPDLTTDVRWSRRLPVGGGRGEDGPWQILAGTPGLVRFDGGSAWVALGGAWVPETEGPVVQTIAEVDLRTGDVTEHELRVPSAGAWAKPDQNFSFNGTTYKLSGRRHFQLLDLTVDRAAIGAHVWADGKEVHLSFDLERP